MALFRSEPDGDGKCWKGFVVMATTQRDEKLAGGAGSGADREGFRRVRWWPCLRPTLRGRDAVIATPAAGSVECIFMTNPADAPATGKREGPCGSAFRYGTADSVGSSAVKCVVKLTTLRWIREQCRNGAGEQVPAQFQFFFAEAVGEEAEVADALSRNCSSLTPESPAVVLLFGVFGLRQRDEGLIVSQIWTHFGLRPVWPVQDRVWRFVGFSSGRRPLWEPGRILWLWLLRAELPVPVRRAVFRTAQHLDPPMPRPSSTGEK